MISARTVDSAFVISALDAELRRWRFERCDEQHLPQGLTELRKLYWRGPDDTCPWTTLLVSDIQNVFETAYCLSKSLANIPVVASRTYSYELWQFKAYLGEECVLRVGDDADHELKWLPRPLEAERVQSLAQQLHGGLIFERFLRSLISGAPDRQACRQGLELSSLDQGFPQMAARPSAEWHFASWQR